MASPTDNGVDKNTKVESSGINNDNQGGDSSQSQDNIGSMHGDQMYNYAQSFINPGAGVDSRQWADYMGKFPNASTLYPGSVGGGSGYEQDEASFVQNFAVQQQPFLGYPYLGFQPPFTNQLYPQFAYGLGQPFDTQSFMGPDGQHHGYFGLQDYMGNGNNLERGEGTEGLMVGGAGGELLMPMAGTDLISQLYQQQLGNALANQFGNLSLQDVDQQRLLHQLYQQQLLQLQHQQLQQQILLQTSQLALQADRDGQPFIDGAQPLDSLSNAQQLPLEAEAVQEQQQEAQAPTEIQRSQSPQPTQPTVQQKPKQEGPRSWAAILSTPASKLASPTTTTTTTTTAPTATASPTPSPAPLPSTSTPNAAPAPIKPRPTEGVPHKTHDKFNPTNFNYNVASARFFVIKSYSEDDIHKAIKYNIWASTDSGNRRLDAAYRESAAAGPIYLFFSVNASGQFCGMARMTTALDYSKKCELWAQDKWNGQFGLNWIFIKDIPNANLRHIRLINNENKPVTNSRDTQEIFLEPGREVLRIFTTYNSKTSILDDFSFYDKRQEIMTEKKQQEGDVEEVNTTATPPELPVATGESRKMRNAPVGTKAPSPQQVHQPASNSPKQAGSSPQTYAKTVNGYAPVAKTQPQSQQRGGVAKGKK